MVDWSLALLELGKILDGDFSVKTTTWRPKSLEPIE
jgi:hypothetical protein